MENDVLVAAATGISAIIGGAWLAVKTFRKPDWYLQRGVCPNCKARKSLLTRPENEYALRFECVQCGDEWISYSADKTPIIQLPTPPLPQSSLRYDQEPGFSPMCFRCEIGELQYLILDMPIELFGTWQSPRDMLRILYHKSIDPSHVDLDPPYNAGTREDQIETFMRSVGIEPAEGPKT